MILASVPLWVVCYAPPTSLPTTTSIPGLRQPAQRSAAHFPPPHSASVRRGHHFHRPSTTRRNHQHHHGTTPTHLGKKSHACPTHLGNESEPITARAPSRRRRSPCRAQRRPTSRVSIGVGKNDSLTYITPKHVLTNFFTTQPFLAPTWEHRTHRSNHQAPV